MAKPIPRRDFLKKTALGAATITIGSCTSSWKTEEKTKAVIPAVMSDVSKLVQVQGAGVPANLGPALDKLLTPLGGMAAFVKKGQSVLIKPNMGFPVPASQRATTSTELIAEVAKKVLAQGASRVMVADYPTSKSQKTVELMGLPEALKDLKVELIPIDGDGKFVATKIPKGKSLDSTDIFFEVLNADVHIAMPIAKSHSSTGFTGTLKGMMGLIESRKSLHWRYDLHQAIVDLNTVIRPDLVIMDGLEIMATDGPRGPGELIKTQALIAGCDPVAVDAAAIRLAPLFGEKVNPKNIKHLALAQAQGLGAIEVPPEKTLKIDMPA